MLPQFQPLSTAEATLLAGLESGSFDRVGDGTPPPEAEPAVTVRASLLRFLLTARPGAPPLHEKGLRLSGAAIVGPLDLEGCRIPRDIGLSDCRFDSAINLRAAIIDSLYLDGSILPSLIADKLEARGGVYLRSATVTGPVRLPGARLAGGLVADGASLTRPDALALEAPGLQARGGVMLRGASLTGGLGLSGARLEDDLDLLGATIANPEGDAVTADGITVRGDIVARRATLTGGCTLTGARVGGEVVFDAGTFDAPGDTAIALNRAAVDGSISLRDGARVTGLLNLNGTTADSVIDAAESWPASGDLALNRFIYRGFLSGPTDAASRLDWLSRQNPGRWGEDFWPQPYEHLAAVLEETGHGDEARRVLIAKERLQRRARRRRARPAPWRAVLWVKDGLLKLTVGYGRRPLLAALWLLVFWLAGGVVYSAAQWQDALRPNVPVVLRSPEWVLCGLPAGAQLTLTSTGQIRPALAAPGESQLDCYLRQPEAASYPKYNPWMHALDATLPALDTGQAESWAPDVRHPMGYAAKTYGYVLTVVGWALSLLAVAGFSGLVRSR